jgi:hypothetical protein
MNRECRKSEKSIAKSMTCKQTSYLKLTAAAVLERAPKAKSNLGKIWNPFFLSSALWTLVAWLSGRIYHSFVLS